MTQATYRLAFIGFGTVGQGAVEFLHDRAALLHEKHGFGVRVVAICTARRGSLYRSEGLDPQVLLRVARSGSFHNYPNIHGLNRDLDPLATIQQSNANVIVEASPTDFKSGEPAITHCRTALESGKHLITANKGPVALAFRELAALAESKHVYFGYEGTVMGGTPALQFARETLAGMTISGVRGIINSTTNFMLTQMEAGQSYPDALAEAQRLGFAEADPSGDVEGHDAAGKLAILANVILGGDVKPGDVARTGISKLTADDVESARRAGMRWKLIASTSRKADGTASAQVRPERLPLTDPLASVNGVTNALTFETDLLGPITIVGAGAGRETGVAIMSDLIDLHRHFGHR
ncbi:MAG: homoserine dehydrogenase [Aggregatilineales bacterium]